MNVLRLWLVLFFVFLLAPILIVVAVSFSSASYVSFPIANFSLRWFRKIYEYEPFLNALWVTLQVAVISASIACVVSVPAALTLARSNSKLAGLLMVFLLSPISMPMVVLGFVMLFYLSAMGAGVSMLSLVISHTVVSIPYIVRTVVATYRGIPASLEETALVLGASRWQVFRHVTFPLVKPGIFAGGLLAMLLSIDNLPLSYFFGSPSTSTLPVVMLSYLENQFDPAIAAISTVQMLLAIFALIVVDRVHGLGNVKSL